MGNGKESIERREGETVKKKKKERRKEDNMKREGSLLPSVTLHSCPSNQRRHPPLNICGRPSVMNEKKQAVVAIGVVIALACAKRAPQALVAGVVSTLLMQQAGKTLAQ